MPTVRMWRRAFVTESDEPERNRPVFEELPGSGIRRTRRGSGQGPVHVESGAIESGAIESVTVRPGAARPVTVRPGAARPVTARPGAVRPVSADPMLSDRGVRFGTIGIGIVRPGGVRFDGVKPGAVKPAPSKPSPPDPSPPDPAPPDPAPSKPVSSDPAPSDTMLSNQSPSDPAPSNRYRQTRRCQIRHHRNRYRQTRRCQIRCRKIIRCRRINRPSPGRNRFQPRMRGRKHRRSIRGLPRMRRVMTRRHPLDANPCGGLPGKSPAGSVGSAQKQRANKEPLRFRERFLFRFVFRKAGSCWRIPRLSETRPWAKRTSKTGELFIRPP